MTTQSKATRLLRNIGTRELKLPDAGTRWRVPSLLDVVLTGSARLAEIGIWVKSEHWSDGEVAAFVLGAHTLKAILPPPKRNNVLDGIKSSRGVLKMPISVQAPTLLSTRARHILGGKR